MTPAGREHLAYVACRLSVGVARMAATEGSLRGRIDSAWCGEIMTSLLFLDGLPPALASALRCLHARLMSAGGIAETLHLLSDAEVRRIAVAITEAEALASNALRAASGNDTTTAPTTTA